MAQKPNNERDIEDTKKPATPREFEVWRKSFMEGLYENTKDAVEVAQRNYLESRLANGIKREMAEIREKYISLFYNSEYSNPENEMMSAFQTLENEIDAAIKQLKERSDAYSALSSSSTGLPFKVETMSLKELQQIELPNYSAFLFDPDLVSFGPLSERWEKLKTSVDEEIVRYLQRSPPLTLGRSSVPSGSSSINTSISELETIEDGPNDLDNGNDNDHDDISANGNTCSAVAGSSLSGDKTGEVFVVGCESKVKPKVSARRQDQRSFRKKISNSLQQLLTSAAQNAENKRLGSR